MINEIDNLKRYIEKILPETKVCLSCPVVRTDNTRANLKLRKVDSFLKSVPFIVKNDNVDTTYLDKTGAAFECKGFRPLSYKLHIADEASLAIIIIIIKYVRFILAVNRKGLLL